MVDVSKLAHLFSDFFSRADQSPPKSIIAVKTQEPHESAWHHMYIANIQPLQRKVVQIPSYTQLSYCISRDLQEHHSTSPHPQCTYQQTSSTSQAYQPDALSPQSHAPPSDT